MSHNTDSLVVSYAQNREDVILNAFFWDVDNGFYVDVGAYDPNEDSVTRYFYERGWSGINIEPNEIFFKKLEKQRPRDINLNVGVSNKEGKLIYREYIDGKGLSTFSDSMKEEYESKKTDRPIANYRDKEVQVLTLKQIFSENKVKEIHFLKVDVEGYEFEVLESNDWKKFRPEVICIEANHILKDWHKLLQGSDYQSVFNDGLNEYFVDINKMERWKNFKYVETVIGREIVTPKQYEINSALASSRQTIEALIQKNSKLKERIAVLEFTLADSKRLKNQIKGLAQAIDNVITVRINNLGKQKYNHVNFSYDKDDSAVRLLEIAHAVDQATYSKKKPGSKRTLYKVLNVSYGAGRKVTKKTAKGAFRVLKSGKRALKGTKK
jgi:FkbM family methyltransferase